MAVRQPICYTSKCAAGARNHFDMADFTSFSALRAACLDLPSGFSAASAAVARREATLTKPPGSLGRLEELVGWLAHWQGHAPPRLQQVEILVFAGNHGVTTRGVSAYPAEVTAQMVANFAAGGAAINQLARIANAQLRVIPLSLDRPTADFTQQPALSEEEFLAAVAAGYHAVSPASDLLCLGEMGIGNTTAAAAIAAALFDGGSARWAGRGTGVDEEGLARKRDVIDQALARHAGVRHDPLAVAFAGIGERRGVAGSGVHLRGVASQQRADQSGADAAVGPGDQRGLSGQFHQYAAVPPSTLYAEPVMPAATSDASKTATAATSSTVLIRLSAVSWANWSPI